MVDACESNRKRFILGRIHSAETLGVSRPPCTHLFYAPPVLPRTPGQVCLTAENHHGRFGSIFGERMSRSMSLQTTGPHYYCILCRVVFHGRSQCSLLEGLVLKSVLMFRNPGDSGNGMFGLRMGVSSAASMWWWLVDVSQKWCWILRCGSICLSDLSLGKSGSVSHCLLLEEDDK